MEKLFIYIIKFIYKFEFKNYLKKINFLLEKNLKNKFTLLDIGAADGVNNKWNIIKNKINIILVEPHKESSKKLKEKGFKVLESVLHNENNKEIKFYNTKKPLCSSFYKPNFEYLKKFPNVERFNIISENIFISKCLDDEIQDLQIRIINVLGNIIYVEDKHQFVGEYVKQIDINKYGKGIYFLEIETDNGIINKKIVLH